VSVPAAFLGVVLIWSTTPLAIKWSSEGPGFQFGVTSRMVLGVFACLILVALLGRRLHWHRGALLTYLIGGLGIWGAMTSVYWGSQYVDSGVVALIFGLSPVVTAIMAALWLDEPALVGHRLLGMGLGVVGLAVVFGHGLQLGVHTAWGLAAVLLAVHIHAASAVWIKRVGARLPALETTTGALMVAVPLFVTHWALSDGHWPSSLPERSLWSILYLALFGSTLGFVLYYYVLGALQASRVALITLLTPVIALLLGHVANGETVGARVWLGAACILAGLACFQWGGDWLRRLRMVGPTQRRQG